MSQRVGRGKVVIFRDDFLPLSETFIRDHVVEMPRYRVRVLTDRLVEPRLSVGEVAVEVVEPGRVLGRVVQSIGYRSGRSAATMQGIAMIRHLARNRPDVVHAHFGPDAALVSTATSALRIPLVATFHGYDVTQDRKALGLGRPANFEYVRHWERFVGRVSAAITVSSFLRDRLIQQGIDDRKLSVIPCGVDTASFVWSEPPINGPVLFVGRLVEKKGLSDLLEAVHLGSLRRKLVVVGDGPLRDSLEDRARQLGVDAEFTGSLDSAAIRKLMRSASLVAMPSKTARNGDSEGLGVVALEAGASGRPVVGYRHGGLPDAVIDGATGRLVPEGDIVALGEALREILDDQPLARRLAISARRHVERNFERRLLLSKIADVYDRVRKV